MATMENEPYAAGERDGVIERGDERIKRAIFRWLCRTGYLTSALSLLLWIVLVWVNPYNPTTSRAPGIITFTMLTLPAGLFAVGLGVRRTSFLLAAFVWSVPIGMYMLFTPSIFVLFGAFSVIYGLIAVLFRLNGIRY